MKVYVLTGSVGENFVVEDCPMAVVSNEALAKLWNSLEANHGYEEYELDGDILPLLDRRTKAYRNAKAALEEMGIT